MHDLLYKNLQCSIFCLCTDARLHAVEDVRHAGAHRGAGLQHPARLQAQVEGAEEGEVILQPFFSFFFFLFFLFYFLGTSTPARSAPTPTPGSRTSSAPTSSRSRLCLPCKYCDPSPRLTDWN